VLTAVADWLRDSAGDPAAYQEKIQAAERFTAIVAKCAQCTGCKRQRRDAACCTEETVDASHSLKCPEHSYKHACTQTGEHSDSSERPVAALEPEQLPVVTPAQRAGGITTTSSDTYTPYMQLLGSPNEPPATSQVHARTAAVPLHLLLPVPEPWSVSVPILTDVPELPSNAAGMVTAATMLVESALGSAVADNVSTLHSVFAPTQPTQQVRLVLIKRKRGF
jgi:hypothetical protein